ncbi:MAG TPA: BA14K family protein [Pseudorhodoplanes sp.]|nr:BA14K family protein [Pseudorhodoplanes sp.]
MLTRLIALPAATVLAASLLMNPTPAAAGSKAGYVIGGIAAGALIGGAIANANRPYYAPGYAPAPGYYAPPPPAYYAPPPGDPVAYCMQRYRSYRPDTSTFIGYDGIERPCP